MTYKVSECRNTQNTNTKYIHFYYIISFIEKSKYIFRDICSVFLSNSFSGCVEESLLRLEQRKKKEDQENCDLDAKPTYVFDEKQTEDSTTIISSYPFNKIYRTIKDDLSEATSSVKQLMACSCRRQVHAFSTDSCI